MIWLLLACAADSKAPVEEGILADEVQTAREIERLSTRIAEGSKAIEEKARDARGGELSPEEAKALVEEMDAAMKAIEADNKQLQELVAGVEQRISGGVDPHARPVPEGEE